MQFSQVYIYPKLLSAGEKLSHSAPMVSLPILTP